MNRLARDVAINLVANLLAAAIIYLAGVSSGLLPYSPGLTYVATSMLLAASATLLLAGFFVKRGVAKAHTYLISLYLGALAAPAGIIFMTIGTSLPRTFDDATWVVGLVLIFVTAVRAIRDNPTSLP